MSDTSTGVNSGNPGTTGIGTSTSIDSRTELRGINGSTRINNYTSNTNKDGHFRNKFPKTKSSYENYEGHYFHKDENNIGNFPKEVINYLQSEKIKNYKDGNFYGKKFKGKN